MQPDPDTNSYPCDPAGHLAGMTFSARPGMPASVRLHHPSLSEWPLGSARGGAV